MDTQVDQLKTAEAFIRLDSDDQDELLACGADCVSLECVQAARKAIASHDVEAMAAVLGALGDPTRLRLLIALLTRRLCTCDLAVILGVSDSAVSHQLRFLRDLRLVRSEREGKYMYHELANRHVQAIVAVTATM